MKDIFDNYIENAFDGYKQAEFKFKQFENNYRRYFPEDKKAKLLDIGIGRGEMLTCMNNWGYADYLGVDISPSTVKFCEQMGLNCIYVDDTAKWLSAIDSVYDVITLLDVLEHFQKADVIPFLRTLYKAVKPGGKVIIQVPNLQAPDSQLHRYNDFTHQIGFIEHSLQQVLIASGIKNISFIGFEDHITEGYKTKIRIVLRSLYWKYCRFVRGINTNLNPQILNPVFFAVVVK